MYLVYLACVYLVVCYLFGAYLLFRLLAGRRLRRLLLRKPRPSSPQKPHADGPPIGTIHPSNRRREAA